MPRKLPDDEIVRLGGVARAALIEEPAPTRAGQGSRTATGLGRAISHCVPALQSLIGRAAVRRAEALLAADRIPRHIAVIPDGNRRWARTTGASITDGHRRGADKIQPFLTWCEQFGVDAVTLWLLSTDNFNRPAAELVPLLGIIEDAVRALADTGHWRVHPVGALALLPASTAAALRRAHQITADCTGMHVNIAVGYGGRNEIAEAVRTLLLTRAAQGRTLSEIADTITADDITDHLYIQGQPDPDLIIRTSGERRLSGFLLWQSAHSEFYFCDTYWPAFSESDFLRVLRHYAAHHHAAQGRRTRKYESAL